MSPQLKDLGVQGRRAGWMIWAEGRMQDEDGLECRPESLRLVFEEL